MTMLRNVALTNSFGYYQYFCDFKKNEIIGTVHCYQLSFNQGSSFGKLANDIRGMYFYNFTYTNQIKKNISHE